MNDSSADRNPVELLAEDFLERQRRGEKPTIAEYCERHPELADEIRLVFPAVCMVEDLKPETGQVTGEYRRQAAAKLERIGDYRLIREVGRGGMGIVYEAEQESLGRHVALKVLPAPALLDQRQLARFQREAKAAARLHHTNIVPVYGVGSHDSTHYYVMQFIQGLGLDEVLEELRRLRQGKDEAAGASARIGRTAEASQVAHGLLTGALGAPTREAASREPGNGQPTNGAVNVTEDSEAKADPGSRSSDSSSIHLPGQSAASSLSETGRAYWHSVAKIGIQVADALGYANSQGMLHRDIKPSNLLLDTQGTVWVTDFGLAKAIVDQDNLTHTGDIVGTLRYMAPERFRGQGDARSDVYSLGLTLYEMLTLRPAFDERQREKLVPQVMHDEPPRPRKLNKTIPHDLETIVLKAIAREPAQRYATPAALAADLQRFIEDKPIQARRVTMRERLVRWCRRNPALASALGLAAAALIAVAAVSVVFASSQADNSARLARTNQELDDSNRDLDQLNRDLLIEQKKTAKALKESREQAEINRRQLVRLSVEQARHHMDRHDQFSALPLATRALELDAGDLEREKIHRQRIASILQQCPRPMRAWNYAGVSHAELSPDGKQVVIVSSDTPVPPRDDWKGSRKAQVWDLSTGKPATPVLTHGDNVVSAKFSPDGRRFCTLARVRAEDKDQPFAAEVMVWDLATHKPVGPPIKLGAYGLLSGFHPSGESLMTVAELPREKGKPRKQEVAVWEISSGTKRVRLEIDPPTERSGAPKDGYANFDPAGEKIVTAGGAVQIWDARTGKIERMLETNVAGRESRTAIFSPDGCLVLAYSPGARLYRVDTGERVGKEFQRFGVGGFVDAAFSPDGKLVATAAHDHTARIWNAATGEPVTSTLMHDGQVIEVSFSADGRRIVTASFGGSAWIWDVATGKQVETRLPHAGLVYGAAFSPDARHVLTFGHDGAVKLWDLATAESVGQSLGDQGRFPQFSPDGRRLATITWWGQVQIWDAVTGRRERELSKSGPLRAEGLAFAPDGKTLAAASPDGPAIRIWDVETGDLQREIETPGQVVFLAYSPDGRRLFANCQEPTAKKERESLSFQLTVWDLAHPEAKTPLLRIKHDRGTTAIAVSKDGRYAALTRGTDVEIHDLTTGKLQTRLKTTGTVWDMAFSPDAEALATGTQGFKIQVWSTKSGDLRWQRDHAGWVMAVDYSHDGKRLLTGSYDGTARIWNAQTGEPLAGMAHDGPVFGASFNRDSRLVVTASGDKTSRVWEAATGHPVTPPLVHFSPLSGAVGFNADGTRLFTVEQVIGRRRVHLWKLPTEGRPLSSLQLVARTLAARDLTGEGLLLHHAAAAESWTKLMESWPDEFRASRDQELAWHLREARASETAELWSSAALHLRRLADLDPDNASFQIDLGHALAESGKIPAAIEALTKAVDDTAERLDALSDLAALYLANRDQLAYQKVSARIFQEYRDSLSAGDMNDVCWPLCFGPDAHPKLKDLADKAVELLTPDAKNWALVNTAGCFLYRAGRDEEATKWLGVSMKAAPSGEGSPFDWVFLAMAHHRQGRHGEARKWLEKTKANFADAVLGKTAPPPERLWRIKLEFLIREAETVLGVTRKGEHSPK